MTSGTGDWERRVGAPAGSLRNDARAAGGE
jgi:hypothetical protein